MTRRDEEGRQSAAGVLDDRAARGGCAMVIGIDLGTSSIKGGLYTEKGDLVRTLTRPVRTALPGPGWAEQDPDEWWHGLLQILDALGPASGIAIVGQGNGLVLVNGDGAAIRPAIIWSDTRAASTEGNPRSDSTAPQSRLAWFEAHEPDSLARARWWLLPKDYLNLRLTGAVAADPVGALGLTDGVSYSRALSGRLRERLPGLRASTESLGEWRGAAVAVGSMDSVAAMFGSGRLEPGAGFDVTGTSETVGMVSGSKAHGIAIRHAIQLGPSLFLHAGPTQSGAGSVRWARDAIAPDLDLTQFFALVETAPPGANGLLFLPYLAGERSPIWNPEARGVFFGLSGTHTRADLCRAVVEGVAFSIRHILEAIEAAIPERPEHVTSSGGAAGNHVWNQIKSDVLGLPVHQSAALEAGTLGAAMIATVAAGLYESVPSASLGMLRRGVSFEPTSDRRSRSRYDALHEIYVGLSTSLAGAWAQLDDINRPLSGIGEGTEVPNG